MEEKYDPKEMLRLVWSKFSTTIRGSIDDYSVCIEIKNSNNECYFICSRPNNPIKLLRGKCKTMHGLEQNFEILFNDKDFLGRIHLRFRNKPINIKGKPVGPFQTYDVFWEYIST